MSKESFQARFRSKNAAPPPPAKEAKQHVAKSTNWYVKIHDTQQNRLLEVDPICTRLFLILLRESLRHHGRPFVLPTDSLIAVPGLSRRRLQLMLDQLARIELILVTRRGPPKPPVVRVPLVL
jgi:hypothetical protein